MHSTAHAIHTTACSGAYGNMDALLNPLHAKLLAHQQHASPICSAALTLQLLVVAEVHVLVGLRLPAQEAVLVLPLHVAEQLVGVIKARAAELAGGVALEAVLRHRAALIAAFIVPPQAVLRVQHLLADEHLHGHRSIRGRGGSTQDMDAKLVMWACPGWCREWTKRHTPTTQ